jgi:hypothetical protein
MNRLALALLTVILPGCASSPPPLSSFLTELKPATLVPAEKAEAEQAVTASLKDPESARFGPVVGAVDVAGVKYACDTVNAKNGMGGYTGQQMYAVKWTGPKAEVLSIGDDYLPAHNCRKMMRGPGAA